jgi:uncharacterized protein (DUF2342 family)
MDLTPEQIEAIATAVAGFVKPIVMTDVNNSLNGLAKRLEAQQKPIAAPTPAQASTEAPEKESVVDHSAYYATVKAKEEVVDRRIAFADLAAGLTASATVVQLLEAKYGQSEDYLAQAKAYLESDEGQLFAAKPKRAATNVTTGASSTAKPTSSDVFANWLF